MKSIFFDFDGTLTASRSNVWKEIWKGLGFDIGPGSYYRELFRAFIDKKITHQQWCDMTRDAFIARGLNKSRIDKIASRIKLIPGAEEAFKKLKEEGFSLFIISGNVVDVITSVLGENVKYFDVIKANTFLFDEEGKLLHIVGTSYDFEGKARFITEYIEKTGSSADDVYFVGNGGNDNWAHLSGCHTICINPDGADFEDNSKWHKVLPKVDDLRQILPEIGIETDEDENL